MIAAARAAVDASKDLRQPKLMAVTTLVSKLQQGFCCDCREFCCNGCRRRDRYVAQG